MIGGTTHKVARSASPAMGERPMVTSPRRDAARAAARASACGPAFVILPQFSGELIGKAAQPVPFGVVTAGT
jgi:hypothetical protein